MTKPHSKTMLSVYFGFQKAPKQRTMHSWSRFSLASCSTSA